MPVSQWASGMGEAGDPSAAATLAGGGQELPLPRVVTGKGMSAAAVAVILDLMYHWVILLIYLFISSYKFTYLFLTEVLVLVGSSLLFMYCSSMIRVYSSF